MCRLGIVFPVPRESGVNCVRVEARKFRRGAKLDVEEPRIGASGESSLWIRFLRSSTRKQEDGKNRNNVATMPKKKPEYSLGGTAKTRRKKLNEGDRVLVSSGYYAERTGVVRSLVGRSGLIVSFPMPGELRRSRPLWRWDK